MSKFRIPFMIALAVFLGLAAFAQAGVALDSLSAKDQASLRALNAACESGDLASVKSLIAANKGIIGRISRVYVPDNPLHIAWHSGHHDLALYLVKAGMHFVLDDGGPQGTSSLIYLAIGEDDLATVKALLDLGCAIDAGYDSDVIRAIDRGNAEILALLLKKGAKAGKSYSTGGMGEDWRSEYYPLGLAARVGSAPIVAALLAAKADPNCVGTTLGGGSSVFSFATPLDIARGQAEDRSEVIALLEKAGGLPASKLKGVGTGAKAATAGLRLRSEPATGGTALAKLSLGERVRAIRTGEEAEIDGMKARWVFVVNAAGAEGWVFGGYLEYE